jgi:cell division protein FtsQ
MSRVAGYENPRAAQIAADARRTARQATARANRRRAWPRWLERAVKIGRIGVPLALTGGLAAWLWGTGVAQHSWEVVDAGLLRITAQSGLAVGEVLLSGRKEADKEAVLAALGVSRGSPMLAFHPGQARAALEALPWIESAIVERRFPDTIFVRIAERVPMALWQHDQKLFLVDGRGVVLSSTNLDRYPNLPILVGSDAPGHGPELLAALQSVPTIARRVDAAVLVGGRRWDLRLDNGVDVRLPESDIAAALQQLVEAEAAHGVLEKDIVAVDLRVPDRLTIQTSAEAAERRRSPPKKA